MSLKLLRYCLLLVFASPAYGCLWDRDTLAHEAQGVPEAIDVIAGRFERNPPLYYQIRRDRVLRQLEAAPADLAAYDDAAVACDRLGNDDQAIEIMLRKARQLAANPGADNTEHRYRQEANIGTFYIHRWIRQGAHRDRMADVDLAIQHIQEALRINPGAHFGREKYQLQAIQWIRNPPATDEKQIFFETFLTPSLLAGNGSAAMATKQEIEEAQLKWEIIRKGYGREKLRDLGLENAVQGLSGLVALGNAWESIDVYHALGVALKAEGRSTLSYLCLLRIQELLDKGGHSLLPNSFTSDQLKAKLSYLGEALTPDRQRSLNALYPTLRAAADRWQTNRTTFMEERLKQGRHPDTDPKFWEGYHELPRPPLSTWHDWLQEHLPALFLVALFAIPAMALVLLARLLRRLLAR